MSHRAIQLAHATTPRPGAYVAYVMSRDQRVSDNHALLLAQERALKDKLPLVVFFNVLRSTGHRRREHFQFMIEGLKEVETSLKDKNIAFVCSLGDPVTKLSKRFKTHPPGAVYFDFSPLRGPRATQKILAAQLDCDVFVVDTHNIIPAWVLSDKEEFAAHTIRNKIHKQLESWIEDPKAVIEHPHSASNLPTSIPWNEIEAHVGTLPSTGHRYNFVSGEKAAHDALQTFIERGFSTYARDRNNALAEAQSNLSPYLHYGQLSSLRVTLEILNHADNPPLLFRQARLAKYEGEPTAQDGIDAFLEELIVRKELSDNFCFYQPDYDSLAGAKDWAKNSLKDHENDPREHLYTRDEFEAAATHDELWNAAQREMMTTGKMHGYMRMYWAKKILEWSENADQAVKTAIYLNDSYHLDGGDPNGYVGILWSIAGVHDRAWFNRNIYGKVRYMARSGAEKKFDVDAYIAKWQ